MTDTVIQDVENVFEAGEAILVKIATFVRQAVTVTESDAQAGVAWLETNAPGVESAIQVAVSYAAQFGLGSNPAYIAAVTLFNEGMTALNAFLAAYVAGSGLVQSIVDGYAAFKKAQGAAATAMSAVLSASSTAPAAAAA
jgi:hypothetical protein